MQLMVSPPLVAAPAEISTNDTLNLQQLLLSKGYKEVALRQATQQNTFLVIVSLKPGKLHPFIVDTGATWLAVSNKLIKMYDLKTTGVTGITSGGDAKRHHSPQINVPYLQVGSIVSRDTLAYSQDTSFMRVDRQPIGGLLGLDFLRQYQALLDVTQQRLYLQPKPPKSFNVFQKKLPQQLIAAGYHMVLLKPTSSRHQTIDVQVNETRSVPFLLDTGVPVTAISLAYARKLRIKVDNLVNSGKGSGGGKIHFFPVQLQTLTIGPVTESGIKVLAMDFQYVQVGVAVEGVIGLDWLRAHHAIIDAAQDRLFVK